MGAGNVSKRILEAANSAVHSLGETLLPKRIALPVFASDALSSVAYAPDEIFIMLSVAGASAYVWSWKIALASALLVDYVLTVAVSISSGAQYAASALPFFSGQEAPLAVGLVVLLAAMNLRGVRESGSFFAVPTYLFIVAILGMCLWALVRLLQAPSRTWRAPTSPSPRLLATRERLRLSGCSLSWLVPSLPAAQHDRRRGHLQRRAGLPQAQEPDAATTLLLLGLIAITMMISVITRLYSPYREVIRPIVQYAVEIREANPRGVVSVYIPEYVVGRWWEQLLHNQTALRLEGPLVVHARRDGDLGALSTPGVRAGQKSQRPRPGQRRYPATDDAAESAGRTIEESQPQEDQCKAEEGAHQGIEAKPSLATRSDDGSGSQHQQHAQSERSDAQRRDHRTSQRRDASVWGSSCRCPLGHPYVAWTRSSRMLVRLEPVAHAGLGEQVLGPGRVGFELPAQLGHVDAQVPAGGLVAGSPHLGQQLPLR